MDKYLLQILLDVNTIIIPGLGALTVTNPKTREMMFMSYLKYDDGKLAGYISEKEGVSENDAKNLIAKYVRDIQTKLDQGHTYDMFEFGRFLKNKDGDIDFEGWGTYKGGEASDDTESSEISPAEAVLIADEIKETIPEPIENVPPASEQESPVIETKEVSEKEVIPALAEEEINSGFEEGEPAQPIEENKIVPEETLIPELQEPAENNDVIEDLSVLSATVSPAPTLDEILEQSEEKTPEDQKNVVSEPIALPTQNEEKVQVENIYIPPSDKKQETIVPGKTEPLKPKPEHKEPVSEGKNKRKRGVGFWILIAAIIVLLAGGTVTVLFYDQVKAYFPFMENKRAEAENETINKDSIEQLNQSAEELESAEAERITGAPLDGTAIPETITESAAETSVAEVVEKPAPPVKAESSGNDGKPYHVIGGAFSDKNNADRYAEKLKSAGNNSVIVGRFDNLYLVSIDSYSSKEAAQNALNGFESITGRAWVFKWP